MEIPKIIDRIAGETTSTGTGDLSISQSPDTTYDNMGESAYNGLQYYAVNPRASFAFEIGLGRMTSGTLARERPINGNQLTPLSSGLDFSAGTKDVVNTVPACLLRNLFLTGHNYLRNGGFDIWNRQAPGTATARSDDTYGPDGWYVLTQTASVTVERSTGDTNSLYACKLTQNQASAQRMGIAQIIESDQAKSLRGRDFMAAIRVKCSSSQAIRIAVLEWTGTADSVTSDVVSSWTNSTFTTGNFFDSTTLTLTTTAIAVTPTAATWTDLVIRGTMGSSANNIIVFVWTEGTAAQNVTLEVTEAQLVQGTEPRIWQPRPLSIEEAICNRYCRRAANESQLLTGFRFSNNVLRYIDFPAMRTTPTISHNVTGYVAGGSPTANQVAGYNISGAANLTISGALTITRDSATATAARILYTAATSFSGADGNLIQLVHGSDVRIFLDAEL